MVTSNIFGSVEFQQNVAYDICEDPWAVEPKEYTV